jgi:hypothetical protein
MRLESTGQIILKVFERLVQSIEDKEKRIMELN